MLTPISVSSNILQQSRKHPSSGQRELTPTMVRFIDEAEKPAKRGKKPETHNKAQVSKPTKEKTPKKQKSDKAVTSPPPLKKLKKPARRLILQSSTKAIEASTSQCQQASLPVDASTKECKELTIKVDKLDSNAQLFLDSLQSERSSLEATRQEIEAENASLHANVNDHLTQLEAELAVENRIMDELDRRTSQLKKQNYKLCSATTELNDLKSEKEVI
ncbi:unnamed protein product [Lactuca saligna]|uniref:Uncharacterized protein n=1 Tax=Lactuca saligna TaxID=75948 RepID=A0AA35ZDK9_LACSI|nr:unnamed protein product [Lactuca saligna]